MSHTNEFHLTWFDGGNTTGWAEFIVDYRAFSRPEAKVLQWVKFWRCGEFLGTENEVLSAAVNHVRSKVDVNGDNVSYLSYEVGGEDFDLVQTIGDKQNVLSPVRFNAVLDWECQKVGIKYRYQARQLRTNTTPERLSMFMAPLWDRTTVKQRKWRTSGRGKDAFAAMQHAIYRLRTIKDASISKPWKLSEGSVLNAYYDCACRQSSLGKRRIKRACDLVHPR